MDGLSEENDEIYLQVQPDNLLKALRTAMNAKWIKIKLTKKGTPCLTFEIDLVNNKLVVTLCRSDGMIVVVFFVADTFEHFSSCHSRCPRSRHSFASVE